MPETIVMSETDPRGVVTVTLNRPEVNNAYNGDLVAALRETVAAVAVDDGIRVMVLRGNGKHFQAGADVAWLKQIGELALDENIKISRHTAMMMRELTEVPKPTIALVHGACMGGGTGIVAACDIVIASQDAMFAISEARWGVVASIIFPQLNAAIGVRNVRRYALSCERFDAYKAKEIGLVHEVCETGGLDAAATPIIDGLLLAGPDALAQSKRDMLQTAGLLLNDEAFERLVRNHAEKRTSVQAAEGLLSFIEKRKPAWYPQ